MPYAPTVWQDGVTAANQTHMNNLETQFNEAVNSFEHDLLTPFVLNGYVASKDGSIANQLDVTGGNAYPKQPDTSLRIRSAGAFTYIASTPNATYYLDINPDGSFSWGTAHSGQANALTICTVTTDGSGNIATVTDTRQLNTTLLQPMAGQLLIPAISATLAGKVNKSGDTMTGALIMQAVIDALNANGVSIDFGNGSNITIFNGAGRDVTINSSGYATLASSINGSSNLQVHDGQAYANVNGGSFQVATGGNATASGGVTAGVDLTTNSGHLVGGAGSPLRIYPKGSLVARFDIGTYNLIVNNGFQYGSGGADDAELNWTDDPTLTPPASIVCHVDDPAHGSKIVPCTHPDCASAGVISTRPSSVKGGALVQVVEPREVIQHAEDDEGPLFDADGQPVMETVIEHDVVEMPDPSPHWVPLAQEGKVPVRFGGDRTALVVGQSELVSAGDGTARLAGEGERHILGVVIGVSSMPDGSPLPDGCVLALIH